MKFRLPAPNRYEILFFNKYFYEELIKNLLEKNKENQINFLKNNYEYLKDSCYARAYFNYTNEKTILERFNTSKSKNFDYKIELASSRMLETIESILNKGKKIADIFSVYTPNLFNKIPAISNDKLKNLIKSGLDDKTKITNRDSYGNINEALNIIKNFTNSKKINYYIIININKDTILTPIKNIRIVKKGGAQDYNKSFYTIIEKINDDYIHEIKKNFDELITKLSKNKINIFNKKYLNIHNETALIYASNYNYPHNLNYIRSLLENGADPNIKNTDGNTVLMIICKYIIDRIHFLHIYIGNRGRKRKNIKIKELENYITKINAKIEIIKVLLENKANPNIKNNDGITPFKIIIDNYSKYFCFPYYEKLYNCVLVLIKLFVENKADTNIFVDHGEPHMVFSRFGNISFSEMYNDPLLIFAYSRKIGDGLFWKLLVENGCNINIKDSNGNTILHIAVNYGSIDDIKYIINNGINKDIQNNDGKTALMIAKDKKMTEIISVINSANNLSKNKYKTDLTVADASKQSKFFSKLRQYFI
jgi:ankyrin repeat protein